MYTLVSIIDTYTGQATGEAICRTYDNAFIPSDPANTDYQAYLRWIEDGNTPQPPDEPQSE